MNLEQSIAIGNYLASTCIHTMAKKLEVRYCETTMTYFYEIDAAVSLNPAIVQDVCKAAGRQFCKMLNVPWNDVEWSYEATCSTTTRGQPDSFVKAGDFAGFFILSLAKNARGKGWHLQCLKSQQHERTVKKQLTDLQFSTSEQEKGVCSGCQALEDKVHSLTKDVEELINRTGILETKLDLSQSQVDVQMKEKEYILKNHEKDMTELKEEFRAMRNELQVNLRISNGI